MPNPLNLSPRLRRIMAIAIALAVVVDVLIFIAVGYAHLTRTHVTIRVTDDNEIVQVFVNCRLAAVYRHEGLTVASEDLGWLRTDDIVTFQVRGWRSVGYYELSLDHDSVVERIGAQGTATQAAVIAPDRVVFASSTTASGRRLGGSGCQSDTPTPLPFATSTAGGWGGARGVPLELAAKLAPIIPWMLAFVGALVLAVVAIRDWRRSHRLRRVTVAQTVFAMLGATVSVASVTSSDFGLAFAVCVAAGACSLAIASYRLMADDLSALCMRWLDRGARRLAHRPGQG
jgi:hypothetical protein